ncbi:MAG: hypothetical protein FWD78_03515 [Treponema sp.]|nr:hypothetical protein [Treponema sp.]
MGQKIPVAILFTLFSAGISAADIKTGAVPRIVFALAFPFFFIIGGLADSVIITTESAAGLFAGLLVFLTAYFLSGKKLGLADVWYSALIGMVFGLEQWFIAAGYACAAGVILIIISKRKVIPFIPCMAAGSILMFFWR